ncbi:MFS transporter [Novosphingobium sp. BL-8H]|uniref:MFS transporter n=1 Tax=Novosphingobium sp. BL-8H TaxID=3127640 RepID=UPI003757FBDB
MKTNGRASTARPAIGVLGRAALIAFATMSGVANSTLSPILPQIEREFGAAQGHVTVTMVLTVLGLGVLIGSPLGGWLADRLGHRRVMVASALLYGLAGCAVMFAGTLEQAVLGRLVVGIALGSMGAAAFSVIGDYWDEAGRNFWSGMIPSVGALAGMALSIVAGEMADAAWRSSFLIYGVGFIAALLALVGIPGRAATTRERSATATGIPLHVLPSILGFGLIVGSIATGTSAYLPHRLVDVGIVSSSGRAIAALSGAATVVLTGFAYGRIRRLISLDLAFVFGAACSGFGLLIMAYAPTAPMVSFGMAIEGVGIGVLMPSLMVYAIGLSDESNRGRVIGLMKGAIFGGPFLVQFALDPIRLHAGASAALAILSASGGVLALWFAVRWLGRRPKLA